MTEREARALLLMPGPEPCCDEAMFFYGFRYNGNGLVTAAEYRCRSGHGTLWTPADEAARSSEP